MRWLVLLALLLPGLAWGGGRDFDGVNDYIDTTNYRPWSYAVSEACWVNVDNFTATHAALSTGTSGSAARFDYLSVVASSGEVQHGIINAGSVTVNSTTAASADAWHHISSNKKSILVNSYVWLDAGGQNDGYTPSTVISPNKTYIGTDVSTHATYSLWTDGQIAFCAGWEDSPGGDVLGADQMEDLANGLWPSWMRPDLLDLFFPVFGVESPEPGKSAAARSGTVNGTTAVADGPPVFLPKGAQ